MADVFNKITSNFDTTFTSIKKTTDLTIHGTGMDTAMESLEKCAKKGSKLYNREAGAVNNLGNALEVDITKSSGEEAARQRSQA